MPCTATGRQYLYLIQSTDKIAFHDHSSLAREIVVRAHMHQCTCLTNYFVVLLVSEIIVENRKNGAHGSFVIPPTVSGHRNRTPGAHDLWIHGAEALLYSLAEYSSIIHFVATLKLRTVQEPFKAVVIAPSRAASTCGHIANIS
jgi:hypothetical protein